MKLILSPAIAAAALMASLMPGPASADQTITCESRHHEYHTCRIQNHGYVRLKRQTSNADCIQGRTWDYDKNHIWVDGNCKGVFEVESRHNHSYDNDHDNDSEKVVAAAAAIAIIAGLAAAANDDDDDDSNVQDRYSDENYYGSRHSSYVPRWMIGRFEGYNTHERTSIDMKITQDGRMRAYVKGVTLNGYINDDKMFVGDSEFYINRSGDGFNTTEVGRFNNVVHYKRVD